MNIVDILRQVESPFTDERIRDLAVYLINSNCDVRELYKRINNSGENIENPFIIQLTNTLLSLSNQDKRYSDSNNSWVIVGSSKEAFSVPNLKDKSDSIFRLYINAKGESKARIIEEYIKVCETEGRPYKLKYSKTDGRDDEIVILTNSEYLAKDIELIEKLTDGMELGKPPHLTGVYKERIGIGEESIQESSYSYTQIRIGIMALALQKFFLDHIEEFKEYLPEDNKNAGQNILAFINRSITNIKKELAEVTDEEILTYLEKELNALSNNIMPNMISMNDIVCKSIPEVMKRYISEHYETAMPEIIENYRLTCEIFGISRKGVFSSLTEDKIIKAKKNNI